MAKKKLTGLRNIINTDIPKNVPTSKEPQEQSVLMNEEKFIQKSLKIKHQNNEKILNYLWYLKRDNPMITLEKVVNKIIEEYFEQLGMEIPERSEEIKAFEQKKSQRIRKTKAT